VRYKRIDIYFADGSVNQDTIVKLVNCENCCWLFIIYVSEH